jgi:hypothetical protein
MDGTAIATVVLAGVTVVLVVATFRLGSQAARDTRAQWRPVLLVARVSAVEWMDLTVDDPPATLLVELLVENVGRGPALDVQAGVGDFDAASPVAGDNASALAPGREWPLGLLVPEPVPDVLSGRMWYSDISKVRYSTVFMLGMSDDPALLFQTVETNPSIDIWWWAFVPRSLKTVFRPLAQRTLRRRGIELP